MRGPLLSRFEMMLPVRDAEPLPGVRRVSITLAGLGHPAQLQKDYFD
jgi:hypothetical protein